MLGKSNYGGATSILFLLVLMFIASSCSKDFNQSWTNTHDRIWAGPDFWANRLQDWQVADGRLECTESNPEKPMRTVHLLSQSLDRETIQKPFSASPGWSGCYPDAFYGRWPLQSDHLQIPAGLHPIWYK